MLRNLIGLGDAILPVITPETITITKGESREFLGWNRQLLLFRSSLSSFSKNHVVHIAVSSRQDTTTEAILLVEVLSWRRLRRAAFDTEM